MQDIEQYYQETIEKLKKGLRPLKLYNKAEGELLLSFLNGQLEEQEPSKEDIQKALCLLEHGQCPSIDFSDSIIELLKRDLDKETLIFSYSVSIKWVVEHFQKQGTPMNPEFRALLVDRLKEETDFEIIEWILRVMESTGRKALAFQAPLKEKRSYIKPKLFRRTSLHQQNCYELLLMLEERCASLMPPPRG